MSSNKIKLTAHHLALFLNAECIVDNKHRGKVSIYLHEGKRVKPILRPLFSMTEKEAREYHRLFHRNESFKGFHCIGSPADYVIVYIEGGTKDFKMKGSYDICPRIGGVESEQFMWLLKKEFDVFGWIQQGLAHNKVTLLNVRRFI